MAPKYPYNYHADRAVEMAAMLERRRAAAEERRELKDPSGVARSRLEGSIALLEGLAAM